MSAPFGGPPVDAGRSARRSTPSSPRSAASITSGTTRRARPTPTCAHCPQGLHDFLRAYYHDKSADWPGNRPYPLASWSAAELAKLPTYYVMDLDRTWPRPWRRHARRARPPWLTDEELAVYAGGVRAHRLPGRAASGTAARTSAEHSAPSCARSPGARSTCRRCSSPAPADWGIYQKPGRLRAHAAQACTRHARLHLVEGAGHWVQQEQPERSAALLLDFLRSL